MFVFIFSMGGGERSCGLFVRATLSGPVEEIIE